MINFCLGVYVFGFVITFLIYWFLEMLGGKSKSSKIGLFAECWIFSMCWPATCWFIGRK